MNDFCNRMLDNHLYLTFALTVTGIIFLYGGMFMLLSFGMRLL